MLRIGRTLFSKLLVYDSRNQHAVTSKDYVRLFDVGANSVDEYRKSKIRLQWEKATASDKRRAIDAYNEFLGKNVTTRHKQFLKGKGVASYPGTRNSQRKRAAQCYSCTSGVSTMSNLECVSCGWLICSCGACGCGYTGQKS